MSTVKPEVAKPSEHIVKNAAAFKKQLTVTGVNVSAPEGHFEEFIKDTIDPKLLLAGQKKMVEYHQSMAYAFGQVSNETMAGNAEIKQMNMKTKTGNVTLEANMRREQNVSAGVGKGQRVAQGYITTSTKTHGTDEEMRRISRSLQQEAAALLST